MFHYKNVTGQIDGTMNVYYTEVSSIKLKGESSYCRDNEDFDINIPIYIYRYLYQIIK